MTNKKKVEIVGGNKSPMQKLSYEDQRSFEAKDATKKAGDGPKNNSGSSKPKNTTNRRAK